MFPLYLGVMDLWMLTKKNKRDFMRECTRTFNVYFWGTITNYNLQPSIGKYSKNISHIGKRMVKKIECFLITLSKTASYEQVNGPNPLNLSRRLYKIGISFDQKVVCSWFNLRKFSGASQSQKVREKSGKSKKFVLFWVRKANVVNLPRWLLKIAISSDQKVVCSWFNVC